MFSSITRLICLAVFILPICGLYRALPAATFEEDVAGAAKRAKDALAQAAAARAERKKIAEEGRKKYPGCRVAAEPERKLQANAGCLVTREAKILVTRAIGGGEFEAIKDTLNIPSGTFEEGDGIAQCTAHRETWEETGLNVVVGDVFKNFGDKFIIFNCRADAADAKEKMTIPDSARDEVSEVLWIDPATITETKNPRTDKLERWRFPNNDKLFKSLFKDKAESDPDSQ